jgi:hypothetical protein
VVAGNQVVVIGKAFGQINFIGWDKGTDPLLGVRCLRANQSFTD